MQMCHRPVQWLAAMILLIATTGQCQQNQYRRAVTEHQLMHDRGRNIQSLKRLIWLSSAIEGLHTAQSRAATAAALDPTKVLKLGPAADGPQEVRVQSLLRDFFNPYLSRVADAEP